MGLKTLDRIRSDLSSGQFEFSRRAFRRAVERNISESEAMVAGKDAVIIEDYPDDKYSPSCLLLGFASTGRPLHIQASRQEADRVRIVTLYEPSEEEWVRFRERR